MKIKLLVLLSVFGWYSSYNDISVKPIKVLDAKYPQINNILSEIYKEKEYYNWDDTTFILNIRKDKNNYALKATAINKKHLRRLLMERKDRLHGYFEFNSYPVVVFGESADKFFKETGEFKKFDWLKPLLPYKINKGEIPPPPSIFEPDVWIYHFKNENFIFIEKGMFSILEYK